DEVVELRERQPPLGLVLVVEERLSPDLRDAGGPVEVPEVRHFLFEGPRREGHAVHEPLLETPDPLEVVGLPAQPPLLAGNVHTLVGDEIGDRPLEPTGVDRIDLRGGSSESGTAEKMRGRVPGPVHAHDLLLWEAWTKHDGGGLRRERSQITGSGMPWVRV